jgi:hypothetical protein
MKEKAITGKIRTVATHAATLDSRDVPPVQLQRFRKKTANRAMQNAGLKKYHAKNHRTSSRSRLRAMKKKSHVHIANPAQNIAALPKRNVHSEILDPVVFCIVLRRVIAGPNPKAAGQHRLDGITTRGCLREDVAVRGSRSTMLIM